MRFEKDQSAGYLANYLARVFKRGLAARIAPMGLTTGTFPVLLELWERDGRTQKQLVSALGIEQATMANTLNRMQRDGLVTRRRDASDGRVQRVWLTDRARGLRDAAVGAAAAENARTLSVLSPEERARLVALMRKVIAAAERAGPANAGAGTPDKDR